MNLERKITGGIGAPSNPTEHGDRRPNASELSQWTATLAQAQAQSAGQLLGAAQSLGATLFTSSEYLNLNTSNAAYLTDLYEGYLHRAPDPDGHAHWLGGLKSGHSRADVRAGFAFSSEFQNNVSRLCGTAGAGGGIRYVLSDVQGSSRAVMNNNGVGTSTVIARHDYLPFGEEIWAGTGLRSSSQGFGAVDTNRWKYGLTERDDVTGLDHTWWRKYGNTAGRWTSPDPYNGSMTIANPQSFNRYSYVQNDPINLIDPFGLFCVDYERWDERTATLYVWSECYLEGGGGGGSTLPGGGGGRGGDTGGGGGGGGGPTGLPTGASMRSQQNFQERLKKCVSDIHGVQVTSFTGAKAGSLGTFSGTGYNRHTGRTGNTFITTNPNSFSSQQLATMSNSYARSYPQRGHPMTQPGERYWEQPYRLVGRLINCFAVFELLAKISCEKFIDSDTVLQFLQVHELGHSPADITGKGKGERGKQLEDCVFGMFQRK